MRISANSVTLKSKDFNGNYEEFAYKVSPDIKVVKQKLRDSYQKELTDFMEQNKSVKENQLLKIPQPYEEINITYTDLKINDYVTFEFSPKNESGEALVKKIIVNYRIMIPTNSTSSMNSK